MASQASGLVIQLNPTHRALHPVNGKIHLNPTHRALHPVNGESGLRSCHTLEPDSQSQLHNPVNFKGSNGTLALLVITDKI